MHNATWRLIWWLYCQLRQPSSACPNKDFLNLIFSPQSGFRKPGTSLSADNISSFKKYTPTMRTTTTTDYACLIYYHFWNKKEIRRLAAAACQVAPPLTVHFQIPRSKPTCRRSSPPGSHRCRRAGAWCARAPGAPPRASLVLGQSTSCTPPSLAHCLLYMQGPLFRRSIRFNISNQWSRWESKKINNGAQYVINMFFSLFLIYVALIVLGMYIWNVRSFLAFW